MLYSVSQRHYFRELSRIIPAGGTVYLADEVAKKYMQSVPGLLAPVRQTTQGAPQAVRAVEPAKQTEAPKEPSKAPVEQAETPAEEPAEKPKRKPRKKTA